MNEKSYQKRVSEWLINCFGHDIAMDSGERFHRFLEEALELAQAGGCSRDDAQQLLEYVFSRPVGRIEGEVGGVMVTLAGVCSAAGIDMQDAAEFELMRNKDRILDIRAKRSRKPFGSPLPQ